ncbi:OmpA family protein [Actinomyces bowdenii]|uniref:OmpA family protein n=2 Tax=Actinomyces bowdenii TaxID=131109 RepID=A0A853EMW5_9ACTO|nr:OmpA family protein [Actinomyces bowdenii]NYS69622.1 OmpA family protein [Actinomyces bowdenii]
MRPGVLGSWVRECRGRGRRVRFSLLSGVAALAVGALLAVPGVAVAASSTPSGSAAVERIPPESTGPGVPRTADLIVRAMEPVSRQGSVDSAVTYSSNGSTTTASLSGDVNFDVDSATLTDRAKQVLDEIVSGWGGTPPESVAVVGHTDSMADDAHNQTLSEQRAQAVADYLTSKVPSLAVESSGRGESEPVASETKEDGSVSEEGKAANRRVEITWQQ